jgi:hypothetical protein
MEAATHRLSSRAKAAIQDPARALNRDLASPAKSELQLARQQEDHDDDRHYGDHATDDNR